MLQAGRLVLHVTGGLAIAGCGRIGYEPLGNSTHTTTTSDSGDPSWSTGGAAGSNGAPDAAVGASGATGNGGVTGAGGQANAGGATNASGATGAGGMIGSAGATGTGGLTGNGGTSNAGGTPGMGGAANTGGATSTGGVSGTGGTTSGCTNSATCTCATFVGHEYRFCTATDGVTAKADCTSAGMRLARIDNQPENDWVRITADTIVGSLDVYIGAEDPTQTSSWQWEDGQVFWIGKDTGTAQNSLFTHWLSRRPTGSAVRTCGLIASAGQWTPAEAGFWYDSGCGLVRPYVCEAY